MNSPITYIPDFVPDQKAWLDTLWETLDWERRPDAPRREYWSNLYGRSYTYGRGRGERTYEARFGCAIIDIGRGLIQKEIGVVLEGCFLNGYEGERDHLGWHSDDDPAIDHSKPIAIITVGAGREIQFRRWPFADDRESLFLESGSLCLMHAGMQLTHEHRIPKVGRKVAPRISLTYRGLVP